MIADVLLIMSSSFAENKCIPLLVSSTAATPKLNTHISHKLIIKGKNNNFSLFTHFSDLPITSITFSELTTISGDYAMEYAFEDCTNLTSITFSELTTISGNYVMRYAFKGCTNLTSVSFPKLTTVSNPQTAFFRAGSGALTIHLPSSLSSLGITNNNGSNSTSYCNFVYDL